MLHGKRKINKKRMTCKKRCGSSNCKDEIAKAKLFYNNFQLNQKRENKCRRKYRI